MRAQGLFDMFQKKKGPEYVISGPSGVATSALSEIGETLGNLQIHSFFLKKIQ